MKRKKTIALGVLSAAFAATFLAACGTAVNDYDFGKFEVVTPNYGTTLTLDEGSAIDGKKEEAFYGENSLSFVETQSGVTVETWAYLGENGLYLYTHTDDKNVYYSQEKQFYENDSVEYYIDPDPDHSFSLTALNASVRVRTDCIQLRIDATGACQTWFGRTAKGSTYPWVEGYFPVKTAASVDGVLNTENGAEGYGIEAFLPWEALGLSEKPAAVGVMPAFNNVSNREDTSRSWFTVKGMSHAAPTSYARVDETGFADVGFHTAPVKGLTAERDDPAYLGEALLITEVSAENDTPATRAELKSYLGADGVYILATVHDKVLARGSDSIWQNDGIEILIDSAASGGGSAFKDGILRVGADIDGGLETDVCLTGYGDYIPTRRAVFLKTAVLPYEEEGENPWEYSYTYVYELMVPYASLGSSGKPDKISLTWAVKTPNEKAYILDRRDGNGEMEGQDWLWTDKHYPGNPDEYYVLTESGFEPEFSFPDWSEYTFRSDSPARYRMRGFQSADGLYLNVEQYVDSLVWGGPDGDWTAITHIEAEIWKDGLGSGDTYFAFFPDGNYYRNSENLTAMNYLVTVTDRGENCAEGYRYLISYEIYLGFANDLSVDSNVQLMSFTPGEGNADYGNSLGIMKDAGMSSERIVWTDNCKYYPVSEENVGEKVAYAFPAWTAWEDCAVRSDAQARYDYRGVADGNGIALNMVQYVNEYTAGGVSGDWSLVTHVEMMIWNDSFGYGDGGTYLAFFPDGSYYLNNSDRVLTFENRTTVADLGADAEYRYAISYEVFIGFENTSATNVKFMSLTTDGEAGYENAVKTVRDNVRTLYTDDCDYCTVTENGVTEKVTPFRFPEWGEWQGSDAPERYNFRGHATADGYYMNFVQYADRYVATGDGFTAQNHVEAEIWKDGLGINDTFFAFFADGTYYCNASVAIEYSFTVTDRGEDFADGYRYALDYQIYLGFTNDTSSDATVWFAQFMPNEDSTGWGNCKSVYRDGRLVRVEDCKNIAFGTQGFGERNTYAFPEWTDWDAEGRVSSLAPTRYDFRGYAADEGLYINMVQYVDNYTLGNVNDWDNLNNYTHIEFLAYNGDFGAGWGGTFLAFTLDGAYYCNNMTNVTGIEYRVSIVDRGADYAEGYRYMISYEIFIGFPNNVNSTDGPYAYVHMRSYTPGESEEGYENAKVSESDGRTGWYDGSTEFRASGIVATGT